MRRSQVGAGGEKERGTGGDWRRYATRSASRRCQASFEEVGGASVRAGKAHDVVRPGSSTRRSRSGTAHRCVIACLSAVKTWELPCAQERGVGKIYTIFLVPSPSEVGRPSARATHVRGPCGHPHMRKWRVTCGSYEIAAAGVRTRRVELACASICSHVLRFDAPAGRFATSFPRAFACCLGSPAVSA